jgi:anti-sigma B factor antagonist
VREVQLLTDAGATVVEARGEVDAYVAPALDEAFDGLHATSTGVVIDLAAVSFMDSTALGALVRAVRRLEDSGRLVRVVLPRGTARRVFELTAVDRILPVAASRDDAVADVRGA